MKIALLIRSAVAATIIGFIALVATNHLAIQELKVNGPIYGKIVQGKDLVADILPPPVYVVEALLEVARVVRDPGRIAAARKRLAELKTEYFQRHEHWRAQGLEPRLAKILLEEAHRPIERFWAIVDLELLPTLERRDAAGVGAAYQKAEAAFEEHRGKIEASVAEANVLTARIEAASRSREALWSYAVWGVALLVLLVSLGVALGLVRMVMTPIERMRGTMLALASGKNDIAVFGVERKDEIGAMAQTIDLFRLAAIERNQIEQQQADSRRREILRQQRLEQLVQDFRKDVASVIETLNTQTDAIRTASATLADVAGQTTGEAQAANQASGGAAENAHAVAAATEELGASIREIASQAHRTSDLVAETTAATRKSNEDVASLAEAAQKIGSIVEIIKTVAEQTNLLALNATIEAARAGEAGKGFAVVATEVKNLAAQTAKATSEISSQIQSVQSSTAMTVDAIRGIAGRVDEINNLTGGIAAAVEEQEAATREIAQNVSSAAERSRAAAASVTGVLTAADQTKAEASTMGEMSNRVADASLRISTAFERFVGELAKDLQERRKAVRHPYNAPVSIMTSGGRLETRAHDVSLTGIRIDYVRGLAPGASIMLDLGKGAVAARCIWTDGQSAGIAFEKPLAALPELEAAGDGRRLAA